MLKLSNGQELDCDFFGLASVGILYIDIPNLTLLEALTIFSNQSATETMIYSTNNNNNEIIERNGFTVLLGVEYPGDTSRVRISMRRKYEGE